MESVSGLSLESLNPEQKAAATYRGGPLLILAGAGTGKTRAITHRIAHLIAQGVPAGRILAITFTNKATEEMRRRVSALVPGEGHKVWIYTFHAFASRLLRQHAKLLRLTPYFTVYDQEDQKKLVQEALKELLLEDQKNKASLFVHLISRAKDDLLDAESYAINSLTAAEPFRQTVAKVYQRYQAKLAQGGGLDFGDLLMRCVELLRDHEDIREYYQEYFMHVLVDEYQDTNHAQYVLTKTLAAKHRNLCVVGDEDQCLPSGTGVITRQGQKNIEDIREGEEVLAGSGWGKTCFMPVKKVMRKPHRGDLIRVHLRSGKKLLATPNHICFGRMEPSPDTHYVYLMRKNAKGYRIGTTSGVRASKNGRLINGLLVRTNQEVADAVYILRTCRDLGEARYYEQYYSVRYGIPTMVFYVRGRRMAVGQKWIDRLYSEINTGEGAERLMEDLHIDSRFPHHRPGASVRGEVNRKRVWFTVFGGPRAGELRPWHEHRIHLNTSDQLLRESAEKKFLLIRKGQKNTWRIETSRKNYDDGMTLAKAICSIDGLEITGRAKLTFSDPFLFMPASHLSIGMIVPVVEEGKIVEDEVEKIERVSYEGFVYDLDVPHVRNFVAEGIVVHNSIYKFRGADIRNILE
ncbi:MAG: UvrD-helicase domain-containing protein, partial [Elusimicrobia bacterium]|nr:UvrD-helicase domain-containing protein [Elusimicrobiota bacterium]